MRLQKLTSLFVFAIFGFLLPLTHEQECKPTSEDRFGPFYFGGTKKLLKFCAGDMEANDQLVVRGKVYSHDCTTVLPGVKIEIWQADHQGLYKNSSDCRGYVETDENGYYEFSTIHPGRYTISWKPNSYRPTHIHYRVRSKYDCKGLVTQLYFADDPYLGPNDSCAKCSSGQPDLVKQIEKLCSDDHCIDVVNFDIYLAKKGQKSSLNQRDFLLLLKKLIDAPKKSLDGVAVSP